MATGVSWQPQEDGFREICGLLEQQMSPSSDKPKILQQLQHYSQFPDFNNYLAFIFAHAEVDMDFLSNFFIGIKILFNL